LLYFGAIRAATAIDAWIAWVPGWPWGLTGAQMVLQTIISLALTFLVFTFGSLLVAIQVAGGQLTARIIAGTLLGNNAIRFTVGLFIFTLLFAIGTLARLDRTVPHFVMALAALLGFGSIAAFLFLIDYAARLLRPVTVLWHVGRDGIAVIKSVYPKPLENSVVPARRLRKLPPSARTVVQGTRAAIVLAVNLKALVALAQRRDLIIEFVPLIGDFVGPGEPLFRLYGNAGSIDERSLKGAVAFGSERTIEQDTTFAFRIIVDIAIRALSKAINDPTTAVLAIDQLNHLLRVAGNQHLHHDEILDGSGQLRVMLRTPNWEDFVHLAFSEIRLYGAENFQIARRLRAMIEDLLATLPTVRHPALQDQLALLDCAVKRVYLVPEELALARIPDHQGLGASSSRQATGR
jgi:uncharacterized membrane protein